MNGSSSNCFGAQNNPSVGTRHIASAATQTEHMQYMHAYTVYDECIGVRMQGVVPCAFDGAWRFSRCNVSESTRLWLLLGRMCIHCTETALVSSGRLSIDKDDVLVRLLVAMQVAAILLSLCRFVTLFLLGAGPTRYPVTVFPTIRSFVTSAFDERQSSEKRRYRVPRSRYTRPPATW